MEHCLSNRLLKKKIRQDEQRMNECGRKFKGRKLLFKNSFCKEEWFDDKNIFPIITFIRSFTNIDYSCNNL